MEWFAAWTELLLSYEIADFVPYDASAWRSLYAQYLSANAPWAVPLAASLLVLQLWATGYRQPGRYVALFLGVLAVAWGFLGVRFHGEWHQQYNWAAGYWEDAFLVQGALLIGLALSLAWRPGYLVWRVGTAYPWLLLLPWLVPLLAGAAFGARPWHQLETAGLAPDPTAWLTLLTLVVLGRPPGNTRTLWSIASRLLRFTVMLVPTLSVLLSVIAAWVTGATDLLVVHFLLFLIAVVAATFRVRAGVSRDCSVAGQNG